MFARLFPTKVRRFGVILIFLSVIPVAWCALHFQLGTGFVSETTRYELKKAPKPKAGQNDVVLRSGARGWAILKRDCYVAKLQAWRETNGEKPMPLPRECATGYRQHKTVATKVREASMEPWLKQLTSAETGYFWLLTAAAFMFLFGFLMAIGLVDRMGRWIFWGE